MAIVSIVPPDREGAPALATVTVRGQATIRTEPDVAILWLTLRAFEESPGKALGDVAQRAEALGTLLDELGVREADRSTAGVSVEEEFDPPTRGNRGLGHRATARIAVHLADPEVIGRVISRASEDLRASIDGPHWLITSGNPARLEAARQAADDARNRAESYAAGVGMTIDGLLCLVEPETANCPRGIRRVSAAADGPDMPIDVEEYEIRATIDATFALKVGDDGRESQQPSSPGPAGARPKAGRGRSRRPSPRRASRLHAARCEYGVGVDDDAILALVTRLARPHPSGGRVLERAAILAEGADFPAVMDWITDHAGQPEAAVAPRSTGGLHGTRVDGERARPQPPARFVLPPGALN